MTAPVQTVAEFFGDEVHEMLARSMQTSPPTFLEYFQNAVFFNDAHRGLIQVEQWPHLLELAEAWGKGESQVLLKARQIGVSYLLAAFIVWRGQYHAGSNTFAFSQGQLESFELINRASDIWDNQPPGWKIPIKAQQKGHISWVGGGRVMAFSSSTKAGRGFTGTVILDEAATHPNASEHYAALRPVLSGGGQFLCVSTAQGASDWFHDMYVAAKRGLNSYKAKFVGWDSRPDRDSAWLIRERAAFEGHPALFRREYPANDEEAFVSFTGMVFGMTQDGEEILSKSNITRPPCRWEEYKWRIAGVDPGGRDPTHISFLGITKDEKLHVHSEWQTKEAIGADTIAAQVWKMSEPWAPIHQVVVDPSNRVLTETLKRMGLPAFPASRDKGARISTMSMLFRTRALTISPWCNNLIDQLYRYYWDERTESSGGKSAWQTKSGGSEDHSDGVDAAGYAVLAAFERAPWKTRDDQQEERDSAMRIQFR